MSTEEPTSDELTIDELARRVGMTVRNVRAHQSRGVLPAPVIRGRTGYYTGEHVARLELVKELQNEGFNLEAIKRVIQASPNGAAAHVLDFTRALGAAFEPEEPEIVELSEVLAKWEGQVTPTLVERLLKLGFVRPLDDQRIEVMSPMLEEAADEIARLGIPLDAALDVLEEISRRSDAIARVYVKLFLEHVWRPFQEAGEPEERWPEVREALERLRPLAAQALLSVFQVRMGAAVERALERELGRMAGEPRDRSHGRRRR